MAAYDRLPPGEKRLADTTLSRLGNLASYSATELAAEAQVSKATAARFFRRVGYASFGHARRQARAEAQLASPLHAMADLDPRERRTDALSRHLATDVRNLTETFRRHSPEPFARAVSLIAKAPRLRVIGLRNGHFVAQHATYLLAQLRGEVASLPGSSLTLAEDLASLNRQDALLVVDFRRRATMLPKVVGAARAAGISLIFIAGSGMSSLSRPGDIVLHCQTAGASIFDSYVAAVSIVNYLGASVARELGRSSRKRLETIETLHDVLADIQH